MDRLTVAIREKGFPFTANELRKATGVLWLVAGTTLSNIYTCIRPQQTNDNN